MSPTGGDAAKAGLRFSFRRIYIVLNGGDMNDHGKGQGTVQGDGT